MGYRSAFHFDRQQPRKGLAEGVHVLALVDELVAAADQAAMHARRIEGEHGALLGVDGAGQLTVEEKRSGIRKRQSHRAVGGEVRQTGQRYFIARKQRACIHVVLDQRFGHDDVANTDRRIAGASHARKQDVGNTELLHKRRRRHGSGNLANSRQDAHSVDFPQLSDKVLAHAVHELVGALHGLYEPLLFFVQGADDS